MRLSYVTKAPKLPTEFLRASLRRECSLGNVIELSVELWARKLPFCALRSKPSVKEFERMNIHDIMTIKLRARSSSGLRNCKLGWRERKIPGISKGCGHGQLCQCYQLSSPREVNRSSGALSTTFRAMSKKEIISLGMCFVILSLMHDKLHWTLDLCLCCHGILIRKQ